MNDNTVRSLVATRNGSITSRTLHGAYHPRSRGFPTWRSRFRDGGVFRTCLADFVPMQQHSSYFIGIIYGPRHVLDMCIVGQSRIPFEAELMHVEKSRTVPLVPHKYDRGTDGDGPLFRKNSGERIAVKRFMVFYIDGWQQLGRSSVK